LGKGSWIRTALRARKIYRNANRYGFGCPSGKKLSGLTRTFIYIPVSGPAYSYSQTRLWPRMSSVTTDHESAPTRPMSSTRAHILAVEDNSETQLLLKHLLKSSFDVVVVSGVDDALDAADENDFDIFLLDINLSGQRTGTDLLHLLRQREELANVPAIALTAYAMPGDREDFLEAGFDQYVSKPFTRADLTSAIETSLEQTQGTQSA